MNQMTLLNTNAYGDEAGGGNYSLSCTEKDIYFV